MNPAFFAILAIGAAVAIGLLSREQARSRRNSAYEEAAAALDATYVAPPHYGGDPSINGSYHECNFAIFSLKKPVPGGPPEGRKLLHFELEGVPGGLRFRVPPPPEAPLKLGSEWLVGDPAFDRLVEVGGDEIRGRAVLTAEGRKQIAAFVAGGGYVLERKIVQEYPAERENPAAFAEELKKLGTLMELLAMSQPQMAERLKTCLKEPLLNVRREALESLVRVGGVTPTAVAPLLEDPDIALRIRAAELAEEPGVFRSLLRLKEGRHRPEAAQALVKLATRRIPAAVLVLREELPTMVVDADRHVQMVAVSGLVVMNRMEALKLVRAIIDTGPGPVLLQQVARVVGKLGGNEKLPMEVRFPSDLDRAQWMAEDLMLEFIQIGDDTVRNTAAEILGQQGTIRALEHLEQVESNIAATSAAAAIRRRIFPEPTSQTP